MAASCTHRAKNRPRSKDFQIQITKSSFYSDKRSHRVVRGGCCFDNVACLRKARLRGRILQMELRLPRGGLTPFVGEPIPKADSGYLAWPRIGTYGPVRGFVGYGGELLALQATFAPTAHLKDGSLSFSWRQPPEREGRGSRPTASKVEPEKRLRSKSPPKTNVLLNSTAQSPFPLDKRHFKKEQTFCTMITILIRLTALPPMNYRFARLPRTQPLYRS